ncbi:MAG: fused MFS/spermidine synthase [Hyphomonadaceae bacterium]|nr:fused MFS/spermidine synthase [Hyphomonadaceae bacterium]
MQATAAALLAPIRASLGVGLQHALKRLPWAFTGTMFLSAALVFSVQPMFAKMVLPRVGGGAAVWTVALVFFQAALLAGYVYAHLLTTRFTFRTQIAIHAGVLVLASFFLPIAASPLFTDPPASGQALWLLALFAVSVGAPFAAASATAPLLQAWYSRTGQADATDPYHLYGASNAGSLLALLAFPILIEPMLGTQAQSLSWAIGFCALGFALMACGSLTLAAGGEKVVVAHDATRASWRQRLLWLGMSAMPSALLVAATTHITTDVASAPLLWVIPLALYLAAFIAAFSKQAPLSPRIAALILPAAVVLALVSSWVGGDWRLQALITLSALGMGVYVGCRALYDSRPLNGGLTEFYLWMSLGGVVGGASTALLAPVVFDTTLEWQLTLALCLFAVPLAAAKLTRPMLIVFGVCLALAVLGTIGALAFGPAWIGNATSAAVLACICPAIAAGRSRKLLAVACAGVAFVAASLPHVSAPFVGRSFYGVVRVVDSPDGKWRMFAHGTTNHGVQSRRPETALVPAGYYGPLTPIGSAFRVLNGADRLHEVAVLGLGAGAMACHARAGQSWMFVEIDPLVVRVAEDPRYFTFLSRCTPNAPVIVGDARLEMQRQPAGKFDLIVADAFSSDAVPTHLITEEAMALYLSRLTSNGVALIHVSNRNLALADVAARAAEAAGATVLHRSYMPQGFDMANVGSEVLAIANTPEALAPLAAEAEWRPAHPKPGRVWTDGYSNILEPLLGRLFSRHRAPQHI